MTKAERKAYGRLNLSGFNVWRGNGKKTKVAPIIGLLLLLSTSVWAESFITETSYFTRASCLKEGSLTLMSNGKELQDESLIAASWDFPLGTRIKVTSLLTGRSAILTVTTRGPSKRLYKKGRRLDVSKRAFSIFAPLVRGHVSVRIERIGG
jgi:hypothetical protein